MLPGAEGWAAWHRPEAERPAEAAGRVPAAPSPPGEEPTQLPQRGKGEEGGIEAEWEMI